MNNRMTPAIAEKVHNMRKEHISYAQICRTLELTSKRSSVQGYYYRWLKKAGRTPWGIEK